MSIHYSKVTCQSYHCPPCELKHGQDTEEGMWINTAKLSPADSQYVELAPDALTACPLMAAMSGTGKTRRRLRTAMRIRGVIGVPSCSKRNIAFGRYKREIFPYVLSCRTEWSGASWLTTMKGSKEFLWLSHEDVNVQPIAKEFPFPRQYAGGLPLRRF